jgi:hypothetical protein
MKKVCFRSFKASSSRALRVARAHRLVCIVEGQRLNTILVDMHVLELPRYVAVRTALAVHLFKKGLVSAGFGARMCRKPLPDFLALLASIGVSPADSCADSAIRDLDTGRAWLASTDAVRPSNIDGASGCPHVSHNRSSQDAALERMADNARELGLDY